MAVRKIPHKSSSLSGTLPFHNLGIVIEFESSLEKDFFILFGHNQQVVSLDYQPVQIKLSEGYYTPDAYIEFRNGQKWICEIKYQKHLYKITKEIRNYSNAYCDSINAEFKIFTEKQIRTNALDNIKWLQAYKHYTIDVNLLQNITQLDVESFSVKELYDILHYNDYGQFIRQFWTLVYYGYMIFDIKQTLSPKTIFQYNHEV